MDEKFVILNLTEPVPRLLAESADFTLISLLVVWLF